MPKKKDSLVVNKIVKYGLYSTIIWRKGLMLCRGLGSLSLEFRVQGSGV